MGSLAVDFGLRGGGRLQDEDCLDQEEYAQRLKQGVRRDEFQEGVGEDAGPNYRDQEDGADLGEPACSCYIGRYLVSFSLVSMI